MSTLFAIAEKKKLVFIVSFTWKPVILGSHGLWIKVTLVKMDANPCTHGYSKWSQFFTEYVQCFYLEKG